MTNSILDSVKKVLGVGEGFDVDILMHINSTFSTLKQLGIGPSDGFSIEDNTATWDTFIGTDLGLSSVKSYVYLKVRLLFDPPTTSFAIESYKKMAEEYEWRLNVEREATQWVNPTPVLPEEG